MKLKSKVLLACILGILLSTAVGVKAIGSDDEGGDDSDVRPGRAHSVSESTKGSEAPLMASGCRDMSKVDMAYWDWERLSYEEKVECMETANGLKAGRLNLEDRVVQSSCSNGVILKGLEYSDPLPPCPCFWEGTNVPYDSDYDEPSPPPSSLLYVPFVGNDCGLCPCLDRGFLKKYEDRKCSDFEDLIMNLREMQYKYFEIHGKGPMRYCWVNTVLSGCRVNTENRWFGTALPSEGADQDCNDVSVLLPNKPVRRGYKYSCDELRDIVLRPYNWQLCSVPPAVAVDIAPELYCHREAIKVTQKKCDFCPNMESYIAYLKDAKVIK